MGSFEDGQNDAAWGVRDEGRAMLDYEYDQGNKYPCFTGDTLVKAPTGDRRIDSLKRGDMVLAWDDWKQALVERPITRVSAHRPTEVFRLSLENGASLKATGNHKLFSQRRWLRVDQLTTYDSLKTADGSAARVVSVESEQEKVPVYNIVVKREHIYIVNGVVAHSFSRCRVAQHLLNLAIELLMDFVPNRPCGLNIRAQSKASN